MGKGVESNMANHYSKWIFNFSVLIFCFYANAQKVTLQGMVLDSLKEPLVYVTLIATPSDSEQSMPYAVTDINGKFKLELNKNISYAIAVSSLGFKTFNFTYLPVEDSEKNIELEQDVTQLDEVVIELPISVKKDTITYRIDKFVTGEERKLKDVLKKLPGIEVDKDGVVTSRGKKVTHLLVENKNFFGGDSKLGVENIPANSVDKVEVIDDYNEISFLKGMTRTDNMAMNIKLKENKKNFVFGDIEAGKGNKTYYKAHANLFYYHPKHNVNFIGGLNNTGEKTFTYKDYRNFIGGPSAVFNLRDFNIEKNTISQSIESTDAFKSKSKVGALNFTKTINDKIDVSSYLIFSNSSNEKLKETSNQYLLPNSAYQENVMNKRNGEKSLGIGKLNFKYVPSSLEQWSFNMLIKNINDFDGNSIVSDIDDNATSIEKTQDLNNFYANGNLEWHRKTATKHAFSTSLNFTYDRMNSEAFWDTNKPISDGLIPFEPQDIYMLSLLRQVQKKNLSGIFKHYWTTTNFSLIHTTIGNQYREQKFFTNDSQLLDDKTINDFSANGFGNDLQFKLNDLYLGLYYNTRVGKFEFQQSLFIHNYSWSINNTNAIKRNKWILLPDFSVRTGSSSSKGLLKLESRLESSFSDISKLASNYYLQSYNSVYAGNENLENELNHSSSLTYSRSNLYRRLYLLGVLNYTYKIDGVANSVLTNGQNRLLSSRMLHKPNKNLNGALVLKKRAKKFKYNLTTRFFSTKSSEDINSNISEYKSIIGSYKVSAQTLYEDFPIIEVGFKQSLGNYSSNNSKHKFTTKEPFFSIDYDFFKKFVFSFDYTHYKYQNKSIHLTNSYNISNASISYGKENSAWNFKISGQNLFNVTFKNQNSFNVYVISDSKTYILPRIVMFSLIYNL